MSTKQSTIAFDSAKSLWLLRLLLAKSGLSALHSVNLSNKCSKCEIFHLINHLNVFLDMQSNQLECNQVMF